jgi:segregation and condensation protein A
VTDDFTVRLDQVFQGPLDLLLHLVREQEVEIVEVEITRIIDGYLAYLEHMTDLDIEIAGDFLVMAATLMAIKSRALLPGDELDLDDELDPQDELIQRLLEYRRFKGASDDLRERWNERARILPRGWTGEVRELRSERELDLGELTVWDLHANYSRLMRETLADRPQHLTAEQRPMRFYVEHVVQELRKTDSKASLRSLIESFEDVPGREALIGSFCALLELVRLELVDVDQEEKGADIAVSIRPEHRTDIEDVVHASGLEDDGTEHAHAAAEAAPEGAPDAPEAGPGPTGSIPS